MKEEIAATVFFMARLAQKYGKLNRIARDTFALSLTSVLFEKFRNHWYPSNPSKGQAFRYHGLIFNVCTLQMVISLVTDTNISFF